MQSSDIKCAKILFFCYLSGFLNAYVFDECIYVFFRQLFVQNCQKESQCIQEDYHIPSSFNISCIYYASNISKASSMCTFLLLLKSIRSLCSAMQLLCLCKFFNSGSQLFLCCSDHL